MRFRSARVPLILLAAWLLVAPSWPATAAPDQARGAKPAVVVPINLNTATVDQLDKLPGVGPKTAALIVAYRQKNGGFKRVEDLMNVRGIGEKSFLKLRPLVTVTPVRLDRPGIDK